MRQVIQNIIRVQFDSFEYNNVWQQIFISTNIY